MKYLLQAIEENRELAKLSDQQIKDLLIACRSGKDDRIDFNESMIRLVDELRNSEHAAAFLTKVAKRDAPDYYDVIRNPMDLGTMLRNVKNGRYKSKAQFMRDLDLIWDNCLTYNSEPTHPLRLSVQIMRNKANHLLTYVNDSNDVREALQSWQPTSSRVGSISNQGMESSIVAGVQKEIGVSSLVKGRSMSMQLRRISTAPSDAPFEQRPAVLRTVEGMDNFSRIDEALSRADAQFQQTYLSPTFSSEAGPSRNPMSSIIVESNATNTTSVIPPADALRSLESYGYGGVLREALTQGIQLDGMEGESSDLGRPSLTNGHANGIIMEAPEKKRERKRNAMAEIPYPLEQRESQESMTDDPYFLGAWWNSTSNPNMLPNGILPSSTSVRIKPGPPRRPRVKKRKVPIADDAFGGIKPLQRNVSTVTKLRKTHAKFGALISHIENEEPIPAALGVVSSDESEGEGVEGGLQTAKKARRSYNEVDVADTSMYDPQQNPYRKLNTQTAKDVLFSKTNFMIAHAGFEATQASAASVLTDVVAEYIGNMGRTFRLYSDHYAGEMRVEELILHSIFQNGAMDVRNMESYIVDDVMRRGTKLSDLLQKLQSAYREKLNSTNLIMEDEAYFNENAEGNNDHIMEGGFAQNMGGEEDFFGFKELGLDKELGVDMSRLVVPHKLFNKGSSSNQSRSGMGGSTRGGGLANGVGMGANGIKGAGLGMGAGEVLLFEPPPPYIPITEAAVGAQIGLLQAFYRDLVRSRGQVQTKQQRRRMERGGVGGGGGGRKDDAEDDEGEEEEREGDEQEEEGHRRKHRGYLVLPEEEMERQRYKVPPNGKMPKRAMNSRGDTDRSRQNGATTASSTAPASATAAAAKSSTTPTSKKKKKEAAAS